MKNVILFLVLILIFLTGGCQNIQPNSHVITSKGELGIIDDRALHRLFGKKVKDLVEKGNYVSGETLISQLKRTSCVLEVPSAIGEKMTPSEIYRESMSKVIMLGRAYRCPKKCKKIHWSVASGVVIRSDGIVVTNYHVVNSEADTIMMAAMTRDGKMYAVREVLAANKKSDVAILKLEGAEGLKAASIKVDEPVGNPVTVISHPNRRYFLLTHGYVSRYYFNKNRACFMNITANYAKGSSGGPLFNNHGELIGLVSSTTSLSSNHLALNHQDGREKKKIGEKSKGQEKMVIQQGHQMTLKNCVPSRSIMALIKK